jgi:hypothetical protein
MWGIETKTRQTAETARGIEWENRTFSCAGNCYLYISTKGQHGLRSPIAYEAVKQAMISIEYHEDRLDTKRW